MNTTTNNTAAKQAKNRVSNTPLVHDSGLKCKNKWHAYSGSVQVGGCFDTKAEAEKELRSFVRSEHAGLIGV